jgi:hypothetical protein
MERQSIGFCVKPAIVMGAGAYAGIHYANYRRRKNWPPFTPVPSASARRPRRAQFGYARHNTASPHPAALRARPGKRAIGNRTAIPLAGTGAIAANAGSRCAQFVLLACPTNRTRRLQPIQPRTCARTAHSTRNWTLPRPELLYRGGSAYLLRFTTKRFGADLLNHPVQIARIRVCCGVQQT